MINNSDLCEKIQTCINVRKLINTVAGQSFSNYTLLEKELKSSKYFTNDVIDYCISYYYLLNKDYNSNYSLLNFIENNVDNKKLLRYMFNNDTGIFINVMLNLFTNYEYYDVTNCNCSKQTYNVSEKISKAISFVGFDYISFVARYNLIDSFVNNNFSDFKSSDYLLMFRFLVSDAYTYMSLNDMNNESIDFLKNVIEDNCYSFSKLYNALDKYINSFSTCFYFQLMLYNSVDYYDEAYELASEKNIKFKEVMSKINPLYKIDYIESFDKKQYRK